MIFNGAQIIMESLKREHVDVVFGYPGGSVLTLYDELYKLHFPHILTGHEQGAVHAADGYARATGKTGVCFATSGPGICNMVTGIATANMDSVPLVIISGQVATSLIGRDSFQEADVSQITKPITKRNYLVKKIKELPSILEEAFQIAASGRPGPVLVDVPKDIFDATVEYEFTEKQKKQEKQELQPRQEADLDAVIEVLQHAYKPIILTGGGIILSDTSELLRRIVWHTKIPVVTTLMGKGAMADSSDLHLGMVGMHGSYAANMAVMECDVLLTVGARFDDRVTGDVKNFAPHARIVHFDIDKNEINKIIHANISVQADLRCSLLRFADKLENSGIDYGRRFSLWRRHTENMKRSHPFASRKRLHEITPQQIFEVVRKHTDKDAIVVTDVGQHQMWTAQFYDVEKPRHFITSGGLGTMGYGLPAAIGAKIGCPHATVLLFSGDGSIMMNCQEFATMARYGVDVKVFILHNHVLGMVNQWQRFFYDHRCSCSVFNDKTHIPSLTAAMGVPGFTVVDSGKLDSVVFQAMEHTGPAVVDIKIAEDEDVLPMVPGGKRLDQMIL